jgi:hypothetical protein
MTPENLALVPPEIYKLYMEQVSKTVRANGGVFVDWNQPGLFKHEDFCDSVHVNGQGGLKYMDCIASVMSKKSLAQAGPVKTE